ncbi:MAG: T9SS type A sorting domain-containing protein [Bacteroidia bacterium]|nr:T9SS type A sorting domain-containing protein [Bacteroidia bacterium]
MKTNTFFLASFFLCSLIGLANNSEATKSNAEVFEPAGSIVACTVDAGNNRTSCSGSYSGTIGGSPTATGCAGSWTYAWTPSTALSSTTVQNPTVTNLTSTTTYWVTVTSPNCCDASDFVTITINCSCCRIENPESKPEYSAEDIAIFPIPAKETLSFKIKSESQTYTIGLYGATGNLLLERTETGSFFNTNGLQVSGYPAGIYYLQIMSGDAVVLFKKVVLSE